MFSFTITTPHEFSFHQCLHFLKRSPHEMLHATYDGHVEKLIKVDGQAILFSVAEGEKQQLKVSVLNQSESVQLQQLLTRYVVEWMDLKTDLSPFYQLASGDPLLHSLVEKYFGYRVVGLPDLFESLSWAIIGQQINLTFAYRLKQQLVLAMGERFMWNGKTYYLFPDPEKLSKVEPATLLALQFSRQKVAYIIALAAAFASGKVSKEHLATLSFEKAKDALMQLKGIGNWTANYVLMKTFHYPSAFPVEDAGLHQALNKQLEMKQKPSKEKIAELFKKYKGWEAYATLYLWRSLSED